MSIPAPRILAITPADQDPNELRELLPALCGLVDAVHLRWPHTSARECHTQALSLARQKPRPALILNERADIALASGVEGVHLRDDGMAPRDLPRSLRPPLVGVSRHDAKGLRALQGADYAVLSPLFATSSKPGGVPLGLEALRSLVAQTECPVLALGGVQPEHLERVLACGAYGVALLSGILGAADPAARAREYREALLAALSRRERGL